MCHIRGDTAEFQSSDLLHARTAIALRLIARHRRKDTSIRIGTFAVCRTLREHASLTVKDTPTPDILLHQRRPHVERVSGKLVTIPNAQLCKIEKLDADEYQKESCCDRNLLSDFSVSHLLPPCSLPRGLSICRRG